MANTSMIINGIEWDLDKEYIIGLQTKRFIDNFVDIEDNLPIKNSNINFRDDKWDFRGITKNVSARQLIFYFETLSMEYKNMVKYFVLFQLVNGKLKVSSLVRRVQNIVNFCDYIHNNGIISIKFATQSTMENYLKKNDNLSCSSKLALCVALKLFFKFVEENYDYNLSFDYETILSTSKYYKLAKSMREENKTPNIPDEYFNKMLSILIKCMNDKNLKYVHRSVSCLYVILSQTGLRLGECVQLSKNALKPIAIKNSTIETYYLEYKSFKSGSKYQEYIIGKTYVNELTKKAFDTLLEIRNDDNGDLLFNPSNIRTQFPSADYVKNIFYDIMFIYAKDLVSDLGKYAEIKNISYRDSKHQKHIICVPNSKQFRVHLCTELYNKNISLLYIRKYMNHLSSEMEGYYVRPKEQKQEDIEYANKLIKDIVENKISILGNNGKSIKENIDTYINQLNIKENMQEIIDTLNNKLVIRAKRGGVCIKTSIRSCSKDARTDEMFCAYNICPNLFHFFFMLDTSYEDFIMTQNTYKRNKQNGFKVQANKELTKVKQICRLRLIPEIEDLKIKLKNNSPQEILQRYPNLENIILNLDIIEKEIQTWMKKN